MTTTWRLALLALAGMVVWGLVMLLMAGCASGRLEPVRVPTAAIVER